MRSSMLLLAVSLLALALWLLRAASGPVLNGDAIVDEAPPAGVNRPPPIAQPEPTGAQRVAAESPIAPEAQPEAQPGVRGVVRHRDGAPAGGARVRLGRPLFNAEQARRYGVTLRPGESTGWYEEETVTAEDGTFAFAAILHGRPWLIHAETPDHRVGVHDGFIANGTPFKVPPIDVGPSIRVRGRVIADGGAPIAGAIVSTLGNTRLFPTRSAADGTFDCGYWPRLYTPCAEKPGYVDYRSPHLVDLGEITIVLRPANELHGRVVDPTGAGVARAEVTLRKPSGARVGRSILTRGDGSFVCHVPVGAEAISATAPGFRAKRTPLSDAASGVITLVLQPAWRVRLVPIGGVEPTPRIVSAQPVPRSGQILPAKTNTRQKPGEDGSLEVRLEAGGSCFFECSAPGYLPAMSDWVEVVEDAGVTVEVPFRASPALRVHVQRSDGGGVPDAKVMIRREARNGSRNKRDPETYPFVTDQITDANGDATLLGLPRGPFRVNVNHGDEGVASKTFHSDGQSDEVVTLVLGGTGRIAGVLRTSDGVIQSNTVVTARPEPAGTARGAPVDASGAFYFDELPVGPWRLSASVEYSLLDPPPLLHDDGETQLAGGGPPVIHVVVDETSTCEISVPWSAPGSLVLELIVDGRPYADQTIVLDRSSTKPIPLTTRGWPGPTTDSSGRCTLSVSPGPCRVLGTDASGRIFDFGIAVVRSGEASHLLLSTESRRITFRVVDDAAGTPVRDPRLRGVTELGPGSWDPLTEAAFTTEPDGSLSLRTGRGLRVLLQVGADGYSDASHEVPPHWQGTTTIRLAATGDG